ncbi:MAG TPA: hypothetical protein VFT43_12650, partial [Candidatus Polarisedimenticolia bacterium]|nr:hypothetical protein [Candidatus Polarisedimenticolia bacterium]
ILDDEQMKIAPLAEGSMKARHALEDAIHAPAFDESAIRAAAAQAAGAESDFAVERGRLASRIRGVLTRISRSRWNPCVGTPSSGCRRGRINTTTPGARTRRSQ